ncbi:MAG: AAA domain-containing protein [Acidobacteriota bacterium]|nr:AAA domain-containing protein [Acidobacteriota bacterium]
MSRLRRTVQPAPRAPFGVSPSTLARYFFHDCDRFLRFRATRQPSRNGVPQRRYESGPVMAEVLESGRTWEEQILTTHLAGRALVADGDGALADRVWSVEESVDLLRRARHGEFLYQLTLRAPASLYEALDIDPAQIEITDNRPDLVQVTAEGAGGRRFRVIDVKRGSTVRLPYRIQVLFYAIELAHVLRAAGIDGRVDLATGAAWLGGAPEPEDFDLGVVRPYLEDVLARLPALVAQPLDEVDWHVRYRCEWCEYLDYCRSEMVERDDVSRLVGLTAHGKRFLGRTLAVRTLPELSAALRRPDADDRLQDCASLAGDRPRLEARLEAHASGEPGVFGSLHPGLPEGENVAVFLTAQTEPVEDRTWLLGMLVQAREDLRRSILAEEGPARPFVVVADSREECEVARERFVRRLYEVLRRIDDWNARTPEWKDRLSVQLYCYSEQERERLVRVLLEALPDPQLSQAAMALLFHLQAPDLLQVDDHPRDVVAHPLIPLVSAAGRLLALPIDVSYTLPETLAALGSRFEVRRNRFHYPFGHGVRADVVIRAWNGDDVDLQPVLREAAHRLYGYRAALWQIRDLASARLVTWPPKHVLISSAGIDHPRLSRLAFLARYESVMGYLAVRSGRCEARDVMAAKGTLRPLVHEGDGRFRVAADGVEIDDGNFGRWLVVRDTPEGLRAQARFNDWTHRARHWGGRADAHVGIGRVAAVETDPLGFARTVHIDWTHWHDPPLENGARVLLMPSFLDFNTDRAIHGLKQLDTGSLLVRLLDDPAAAAGAGGLSRTVVPAEAAMAFHLTPSQAAALRTITRSRVTAIWGPPGSGKTHFLAALALGLCGAPRRRRRLRILIAAMTHAAIDNLLQMIVRLADDLHRLGPALAKVGRAVTHAHGRIQWIAKEQLDSWLDEHDAAIVGSTVWGLAKSEARFDLVMIDEASQLRVPDAALAIDRVHERGRLVAAGDHFQLGPIIKGAYPDPAEGEPVLHGSVFDLLRGRPDRPGTPLCQLLENWRMCDVLTGAARLLYGPDYRCASPDVASRRLRLRRRRNGFTGACLAPDAPLVVVILQGVQATNANEVEAALVSRLAITLRDDMADVADDDAFWRERLFVVSPHHAQIRAIRRALAGDRDWSARPLVDTVEKMQGQEADAVFVSYGVADPEYAALEADFIYSRNRLNVAVTRARAKSVVFLAQPLLDASPEILDAPGIVEGLGYMRDLVQLARRHGRQEHFDLEDGVAAEVAALDREVVDVGEVHNLIAR